MTLEVRESNNRVSAPATPARSAFEYALLIVLCIGIPPAAQSLRTAHTLAAPQEAMYGMTLVNAEYWYVAVCLFGTLLIFSISARCLVLRLPRWLLALPTLSFVTLFLLLQSERADLFNQAAMRRWFATNHPALNSIADRVTAGETSQLPAVIANVTINSTELLPNVGVILYTSIKNRARWGNARLPIATADEMEAESIGILGKEAHFLRLRRLSGNWFVLYDAYRYAKRGWS